jgi:acyl-CoA hydrolase
VDAWVEHDEALATIPDDPTSPEDVAIARLVVDRIQPEAILQFGIGAVPDEIARRLAAGSAGGFGIHTEMLSDGVMLLHEAGKVTNRKPLHSGQTVATFALGSEKLYRWLDGNPAVRILPVSDVNDAWVLRQLPRLTSINGALAIDLAGQVAADSIGPRQYSGAGGHESFVAGAGLAPEGRSFLCLASTATVRGKRVSTIVPSFPEGTRVTTPRHHVQYVVTEHGAVDLSVLSDVERPAALIQLAHPDFRDELRATFRETGGST